MVFKLFSCHFVEKIKNKFLLASMKSLTTGISKHPFSNPFEGLLLFKDLNSRRFLKMYAIRAGRIILCNSFSQAGFFYTNTSIKDMVG
jgi:hypothetical protein